MLNNKFFIFIFFILLKGSLIGQILEKPTDRSASGRQLNDSIYQNKFSKKQHIKLSDKTHFTDYKIISFANDTTVVDTTLSLKKERLFNHLRKDIFELNPLHNLGMTYNSLGYDFSEVSLFPHTGMSAKHVDYLEREDVKYFHLPTPTSELFFRTGIQQGQILNSSLATNVSPELNISLAYKGLRSLGDYRYALASHQNFRVSTNYQSKKKTYQARFHYAANNLMNQENGGLTEESIQFFKEDNKEYHDRERLEVNFTDAESLLKNRSIYLDQQYKLWETKDSATTQKTNFNIGHSLSYSNKYYKYTQNSANDIFGEAYQNSISDSLSHKTFENTLFGLMQSPYLLGSLKFQLGQRNESYAYNRKLILEEQTIPSQIKDNQLFVDAEWKANFKKFHLKALAGSVFKGDHKATYISGKAGFAKDSLFQLWGKISFVSKPPNFNTLLYQSDYVDYNWYHPDFNNEQTQYISGEFLSDKWADVKFESVLINNYTYFGENSQPKQLDDLVYYTKIRAHKAFTYKKFTLDNTLLVQKVLSGEGVFHVPEIITENAFYYTDYLFKGDPLYLQTGINFKYFTSYYAQEFSPLLNEFYLQKQTKIGNYPLIDIFVNGQIRRTRIYFKAENVNSFFTGRNYFVTPTQPYRDFTIRFGLVWNFFI